MPFTFSHPAIVLPLAKFSGRFFSLTGLIIGSLTPDFEYFFRMKVESKFSHTIAGLFYFDLPTGIILAFIFHDLIRNSLYKNLPLILKSRIEIYKNFNWNLYFKKNYAVVIISILIGAYTHLIWDSFTHQNGYSVLMIPFLQKIFTIGENKIPMYKILQHLSSLIGGLFIVFAFFHLPVQQLNNKTINFKYWFSILIIILLITSIKIISGINQNQLSQLLITIIDSFLLALIFAPVVMQKFFKPKTIQN